MAKNFSDATFFIEEGQVPLIGIVPHHYQDDNDKEHVNARIEIESSDEDEFTLNLSLPVAALKQLIVAAQEFLDEPGKPDMDLERALTCCHVGGSVN
jgi:hypothetical protein